MRTTLAKITIPLAAALTLIAVPALAQSASFRVHDNGGSRVQFVSDAPLETITGLTSAVTGTVQIDPHDLSHVHGRVAARVGTLHTGIDLRDEHLRSEHWLDAAHFPEATFEITGIEGAHSLTPNQNTRLKIHGHFTVHGVTHDVVADARARYVPFTPEMRAAHVNGDVVLVQAKFPVKLTDYGLSIPAPVRLKVSNDIDVEVALRATAG